MKPTKPFADFWIDEEGEAQFRQYDTRLEWVETPPKRPLAVYYDGRWQDGSSRLNPLSPQARLALAAAGLTDD